MSVGVHHYRHAGLARSAHVLAAQVEPVGQPVHLHRSLGLPEPREDRVEIHRVRRPPPDQSSRRVAQRAHVRRLQRCEHAPRQLLPRGPLTAVNARLHPVELRQQVLGQIQRPVAPDVALDPTQQPERRELLVRLRDFLRLPPHVVGR